MTLHLIVYKHPVSFSCAEASLQRQWAEQGPETQHFRGGTLTRERAPEECQCIILHFSAARKVGLVGRDVGWAVAPAQATWLRWFQSPSATCESSHDEHLQWMSRTVFVEKAKKWKRKSSFHIFTTAVYGQKIKWEKVFFRWSSEVPHRHVQDGMSNLKHWILHVLPTFILPLAGLEGLVLLYCVHHLCFNNGKRGDFCLIFFFSGSHGTDYSPFSICNCGTILLKGIYRCACVVVARREEEDCFTGKTGEGKIPPTPKAAQKLSRMLSSPKFN